MGNVTIIRRREAVYVLNLFEKKTVLPFYGLNELHFIYFSFRKQNIIRREKIKTNKSFQMKSRTCARNTVIVL